MTKMATEMKACELIGLALKQFITKKSSYSLRTDVICIIASFGVMVLLFIGASHSYFKISLFSSW